MSEVTRILFAIDQGDPHAAALLLLVGQVANLPAAAAGGQRSQRPVSRRRPRREGPSSSHSGLARRAQGFLALAGAPKYLHQQRFRTITVKAPDSV
jgi:hypothetical protein